MQSKTSSAKNSHEIKNTAFAFGVYGANSKRIADVSVTDKGLVWNNGKSSKDVVVKWEAFVEFMQSQIPAPVKKAAPSKARSAAPKAKAPAAASKTKKAAKSTTNSVKRAVTKKTPAKAAAVKASGNTVH
ncbi:MAG: hypothetical protein KTR19_04660 [Hyphomicrobiales bacterium]|nr:hypothetical protein [Hyphomicrobiales bacterium]